MNNIKSSYKAVLFFFQNYQNELVKIYSLTFLYAIFETLATGLLGLSFSTISSDIENSRTFLVFKKILILEWISSDVFINIYILTLLFLAISFILGLIFTKYIATLSAKIGYKSVEKLLFLISDYSWEHLKDLKTGDVSAKINSQAIFACNFLFRNSLYIFNKFIVLLLLIIASIYINFQLTLISLFVVTLIYFVTFRLQRNKLNFYANKERDENINAFNLTNNTFKNIEKINATNTTNNFTYKIYNAIKERFSYGSLINYYATIPKIVIENSIFLIVTSLLLVFYILINLSNPFVADIFLLSVITLRLLSTFQSIYGYFVQNSTYVESWEYLKEDLKLAYAKKENKKQLSIFQIKDSFSIKNLTYKHNNSTEPLFHNFSYEFKHTGLYVLTGKSGVGKTTLLRVLAGILGTKDGKIYIDNKQEDIFSNDMWKNTISYIPQSQTLFNTSLRENFLLLNPDGEEEQIWQSLEFVKMKNFVDRLPKKLDTIIGPDGVGVSGGEEQRLILATSVFQDRKVLFFDEITNELDKDNRIIISQVLHDFAKNKLVIGISHDDEVIEISDSLIELN